MTQRSMQKLKIMNKYWHGFAQSITLLNVFLFPTVQAAEQIIVISNARKDLPTQIESTNVVNKSYVWQLDILPNQNTGQIQVKLLNPNPNSNLLNNRALEIARKIDLAHLPKIPNAFNNKALKDKKDISQIHYYYGRYTLFIKFPETVQYAVKPNFSQLQTLLEPFCNQNNIYDKNKLDSQENITINTKLFVDQKGYIQHILYFPAIVEPMQSILQPVLKRIRFHPRNEYGLVKPFSIEQPIIIQCSPTATP